MSLELTRYFLVDGKPAIETLNFLKAGEGDVERTDPRAQVEFPDHDGKYFFVSGNPMTLVGAVAAEYAFKGEQVPTDHPFFWNPITAPLADNVEQISKEEFLELIKT